VLYTLTFKSIQLQQLYFLYIYTITIESATSEAHPALITPPKTHHLTRDQRRDILLLKSINYTAESIYTYFQGNITRS
jgi:hypothetical protein